MISDFIIILVSLLISTVIHWAWNDFYDNKWSRTVSVLVSTVIITVFINWTINNDKEVAAYNARVQKEWLNKMQKENCHIVSYSGRYANIPIWKCPNSDDVIRGPSTD